jgi:hypothetical protein
MEGEIIDGDGDCVCDELVCMNAIWTTQKQKTSYCSEREEENTDYDSCHHHLEAFLKSTGCEYRELNLIRQLIRTALVAL